MKVLFIIYLISIAYFFISFILLTTTVTHRVRKEGLKFEKMGVAETILTVLRVIILAIIPVFNLIIGSSFLFSNSIQDLLMDKMREKSI